MSTLSVRLPNSLHKQIKELAERDGISMNQLISSAVAEKTAALLTEEYLDQRASRGSRKKFLAVLRKVADIEPPAYDRLGGKGHSKTLKQAR